MIHVYNAYAHEDDRRILSSMVSAHHPAPVAHTSSRRDSQLQHGIIRSARALAEGLLQHDAAAQVLGGLADHVALGLEGAIDR